MLNGNALFTSEIQERERESRDRERKKSWKEGQKGVRVRCRNVETSLLSRANEEIML